MAKDEEQKIGTHLNLLQGGPLHNKMLTNTELVDRESAQARSDWDEIVKDLHNYRWTADTVVGAESGRIARVWRFNEAV